ncbi:MAG TPA: uroporphyrinogen-III synthase [Brevundimonas sp.]|nr:uroporphyrinogen-III synthase [Brevundimonas sp.]
MPGAGETAGRLRSLGYDPVVAPLLRIRPVPQPTPDLDGVAALVFTSRNGVAAFASLCGGGRSLPVFTVGAATAEAARAAGFASVRSADGDLADLARLLEREGPAGGRVLAPGAVEPAGDLAALTPTLMTLKRLPVYEAVATGVASPHAFEAVLLHSPRAGRMLADRGPFAGGTAVAISVAAAEALGGDLGLEIRVATRPDEPALLAALGKAVPPV